MSIEKLLPFIGLGIGISIALISIYGFASGQDLWFYFALFGSVVSSQCVVFIIKK